MKYIAYTDGSYQDSVGAGGCASVILDENNKVIKIICDGFKETTNNRMEIRGVLNVLDYFKQPTKIEIISDSQYVINSITEGHVKRWFREKDFNKKNLDLWFKLLDLIDFHKVSFTWVKGHNGNKWNEFADILAVTSSKCLNLQKEWQLESHLKR